MKLLIDRTFLTLLFLLSISWSLWSQVEITPQGAKGANILLQTTTDVSQTGTPTLSQLIYNSNPNVTGSDANGAGYYFWNGSNWQSLDANVPSGTVVFSENHPNQALLDAGFGMIGTTQMTTPALDVWRKISKQNAPLSTNVRFTTSYNGKFFLFGNSDTPRVIYDPITDTWSAMNSINAPSDNAGNYSEFKDRVLFFDNSNFINSKIYNPSTNSWANLSSTNANTALNWVNHNRNSNTIIALSENQPNKILDLAANTWTDISTTNAPNLIPNSNWGVYNLNLREKFMMYIHEYSNTQHYVYNAAINQWTIVDTTNAPNSNDWSNQPWVLSTSTHDTSIVFTKSIYNTGNKYDLYFKRYSIAQNAWFDDIAPFLNAELLTFIGNYGEKYYFYNYWGLSIAEYKRTTNAWRIIQKHEDDVEFRTANYFIRLCGNKLIIHGGRSEVSSLQPWLNDGYMYDILAESWQYIPSLFGLVPESSTNPAVCCDHRYFFAFCNSDYSVTLPNRIVNKSGIMQLSGPTNQTTQKTLYLYRKN